MLISEVSVRCTGQRSAISSSRARCSSVRPPSIVISDWIRSSMPSYVSHSAQSVAWMRECSRRTVITPASIVRAIEAGYVPALHPSAHAVTESN